MKLILCAVESSLAEAWESCCGDLEFVSVHRGSILEADEASERHQLLYTNKLNRLQHEL